jgi:hypothetical protein
VDRTGGDKPTPFFQIYLDEDGGEREIARFDCSLMLSSDLLHILKKQDFDKWVDNHLHIKQVNQIITFEISPDPGGIMTRFTLKYEECRIAFEQLLGLCPKEDTFREEAWQQWRYGTKPVQEIKVVQPEEGQAFLKEITEISRRDLERAQAAVNMAITNLESFDVTADVEASSDED